MTSHTMTMAPYNGSAMGSNGVERRFSLPTGYRLLNDLSSLKRQGQRVRKDNLVTRGGGSVKVRHVPILLEVEEKNGEEQEQEKETKEVKRGTMTAAPIMLQTNGHQASQKARPPRFSLPSPSVTESAKVQESCSKCFHLICQSVRQQG